MPLTAIAIRSAKPGPKPQRLFDGGGLYMEVSPGGGKWWRLKYRIDGREKRISLGVFPEISLVDARERRDHARKLLRNGIDPGENRKLLKASEETANDSFEVIAREWFAKFKLNWVPGHSDKIHSRLERDLFPWLGSRSVKTITAPEILSVLRRIESRGALDTAHRAKQDCSAIFRYAVATGRAERDPTGDLRGALPPAKGGHFPTIVDPKGIGELLRALYSYSGGYVTACALRMAPLVFVRPGELRHAEWSEFDLEKGEWRIPGAKMKMRAPHVVPLSIQALVVLNDLRPLTEGGRYVFPSERSQERPMSENTVNAALRRLGYSTTEMSGHGFRAMASTILNEHGWNKDAIERQLAHSERNHVRAAYNYAEHLPERRKMMQAWADYLDELREGKGAVKRPFEQHAN